MTTEGFGPALSWPNWNYVRAALAKLGVDQQRADEAISTFPQAEVGLLHPYTLVWRSRPGSGRVQPDETIGLSMAGLLRVDEPAADGLARLAGGARPKGRLPYLSIRTRCRRESGH